ncbi:MAG: hypothetical protein ACRD5L_00075 [Bryobacteraceae bacterium]
MPLGATATFSATVTNAEQTGVTWSVNNVPGGNASMGTISAGGLFSAPGVMPNPATVTVKATSVADDSKSASAVVTLTEAAQISVQISPGAATVLLGMNETFTATVSNSTNTAVIWSVNGQPGGTTVTGAISATGVYTAPGILPQPSSVIVRATSQADATRFAEAAVTVASDVGVGVAPPSANVELGAAQSFAGTISSQGHPATGVAWSISGAGCGGATCGSVDAAGIYTAPGVLPSPPSVRLTAASVADPLKTASASLVVTSNFGFSVSGPASLNAAASATYIASLTPVPGSHPSTGITWSISGASCPLNCGTISSQGGSAIYFAPATLGSPILVVITATPAADSGKAASVTVTVSPPIQVTISPLSANVLLGAAQMFAAQVVNATDTSVTWDVNGVVGGNSTFG